MILGRYAPAAVLINDAFEILQFRGKTSPYLEAAPGVASFNILKMAREGLLVELRSSILKARRAGRSVRKEGLRVRQDGHVRAVNLEIVPMKQGESGLYHFLVLFEEADAKRKAARVPTPEIKSKPGGHAEHDSIVKLEQELTATKDYLQAIIEEQEASNEELKSANEEILSANEELQSTNEELETAKEELQSTNEELTTVNEELQNRNVELSQLNNDLQNILTGTNVAIVMLGPRGPASALHAPGGEAPESDSLGRRASDSRHQAQRHGGRSRRDCRGRHPQHHRPRARGPGQQRPLVSDAGAPVSHAGEPGRRRGDRVSRHRPPQAEPRAGQSGARVRRGPRRDRARGPRGPGRDAPRPDGEPVVLPDVSDHSEADGGTAVSGALGTRCGAVRFSRASRAGGPREDPDPGPRTGGRHRADRRENAPGSTPGGCTCPESRNLCYCSPSRTSPSANTPRSRCALRRSATAGYSRPRARASG